MKRLCLMILMLMLLVVGCRTIEEQPVEKTAKRKKNVAEPEKQKETEKIVKQEQPVQQKTAEADAGRAAGIRRRSGGAFAVCWHG